jgi:hypothetical protein
VGVITGTSDLITVNYLEDTMTKTLISIRVSDETKRQIDDLMSSSGRTQTDVISIAIDRMYQEQKPLKRSYTITAVETRPEPDPLNHGHETHTALALSPRDRTIKLYQDYNDEAVPSTQWLGIVLSQWLQSRPDEDAARNYLTNNPLITKIIDGHSIDWVDDSFRGSLTKTAQAAWDELVADLENLPETNWSLWDVADWLHDWAGDTITAATTDDELKKLVEQCKSIAAGEHVVLDGDILDYITSYRDEARDE